MVIDSPYTVHTLDNGLEIVIERMPDVRSAAAGFLVKTGARDEEPADAGLSHFLEHMMFKGTAKRTWRDITVGFDGLGSTYNAYTSEDRTIYYGWVRTDDLPKQMELLADMMRSSIPIEEFETEKKVVLEEIAMAKDGLEHVAFDFLQEKVFKGHPLAWPILGYKDSVTAMSRDRMYDYFQQRYAPDNMLLVVAGNVDPQRVIDHAEKLCGSWKASGTKDHRTPPTMHTGTDRLQLDRFKQQVIALTFPAATASSDQAESASAVASILGGNNSRFYWNIVLKGLAPRAGAYHLDYTDYGAMILLASCQPENTEKALEAVRKEAKRISDEPVSVEEVERVKNKRRTGLAVEAEAPYYRLTQLMDDLEYHGAPRTVEQSLAEVDAVSVESIQAYLNAYPITDDGHLTSVGPRLFPETV